MFMNESGVLFTILNTFTASTGSMFLTLLIIVVLIMVACFVLGLGMEWSAILILPLMLTLMAYDAMFYPAGGLLLFYVAALLAKNFLFNR